MLKKTTAAGRRVTKLYKRFLEAIKTMYSAINTMWIQASPIEGTTDSCIMIL
jgi:hypothetical protein